MDRYFIWGFPGIGKSSVTFSPDILDADCNLFQFRNVLPAALHSGSKPVYSVPDPGYPQNYLDYVRSAGSRYILLNCHLSLLQQLPRENLFLIYPSISLKDVYLQRYLQRGDNESFVSFMDDNFADMVHTIEAYPCRKKCITDAHIYLNDILKGDFLMNEFMTKQDLTCLLNEATRYHLLPPEMQAYDRCEDIAQAIFEGEIELDFGKLRQEVHHAEKAAEAERLANQRRGGLSRDELADKLMQGIVNGALGIHHGQIAPYSYGYEVTVKDGKNLINRWECYCPLWEVSAKLVNSIEHGAQSFNVQDVISVIDQAEEHRITGFTPENQCTLRRSNMPYSRGDVARVADVHTGNGLDGIVQHHYHGDYSTITTSSQNDLVEALVYLNGFCLDQLPRAGFHKNLSDFIVKYLKDHGTDISTSEKLADWIYKNPDKCALPANRTRSKPLDSQIAGASQRSGVNQNPRPGKEAER